MKSLKLLLTSIALGLIGCGGEEADLETLESTGAELKRIGADCAYADGDLNAPGRIAFLWLCCDRQGCGIDVDP